MHHRIKNNLQTIADLLTLEIHSGRKIPTDIALMSIARGGVLQRSRAQREREGSRYQRAEMIAEKCVAIGSEKKVNVIVQGADPWPPSDRAPWL